MSVIHVNQIKNRVHQLFDGKIDLSDVDKGSLSDKDRENFFLSRSLAAYALYAVAHADVDIAAASITDGGNDNGIDAIYYDEREKRLYIVQSKWIHDGRGEPENGEVKKFIAGIKDLINQKFDRFNTKMKQRRAVINQAMNAFGTRFQIILAYTGADGLAEPSARDFEDLKAEMNDTSEDLYVTVLRQKELHRSLITSLSGEPITLEVTLQHWGKIESPQAAYYGQVSGRQIVDWWSRYETQLFVGNLRGVLGDTDVNDEMRNTLQKEPANFWYFNNGITLISNTVTKNKSGGADRSTGTFQCEGVRVVNGAQTVSTIGRHYKPESSGSEDVYVQLRVISLEESENVFGGNITKTNNRQNKIENRDFVSLDPEQARIRNEMAIDGIQYHLLRSEVLSKSETSCDLVESTTALACATVDSGLAVQLKREIGKLWEDLNKAPYKTLFNPTVSGLQVWRCVQVQRSIDDQVDSIAKELEDFGGRSFSVAVHGNRIISSLVFATIPKAAFVEPGQNIAQFTGSEYSSLKVKWAFNSLLSVVESEYSGSIIPTLFKNATKCKHLFDTCRQQSPE